MPHHRHHPIKPHHKTHATPSYVTAFIARITPAAKAVNAAWGVPVCVVIAQAALESSWGQHVKGNAYFGVKGKSSAGASVSFATHEVANGHATLIHDSFRAYTSLEEAADDYGRLLRNNPRFSPSFAYSKQPDQFVDHVARAGYATDPNYAAKLKNIIKAHRLDQIDAAPGSLP